MSRATATFEILALIWVPPVGVVLLITGLFVSKMWRGLAIIALATAAFFYLFYKTTKMGADMPLLLAIGVNIAFVQTGMY